MAGAQGVDALIVLRDANLAAFLATIRACEGTDGPNGYRMLFGGKLFSSYETHPRVRVPFTQTDGKRNYSTAAGAYQILARTWDALQARLDLPDFSPESQDEAAIELINERGAIPAVVDGELRFALDVCAPVWASLPASSYPQPKRTYAFAERAYLNAGGALA